MGGERLTRVRLSERIANANEICARCRNDKDGECKLPVLIGINKDRGTVSTSKLISFSEDGKTCQLFAERGMSREEWLRTVTPFDVLCPICGERFKDTTYLGFLFTPPVVMCRVCAEHFAEKSCYSGLLFVPWRVKG